MLKCHFCGEEIQDSEAYVNLLNHPSGFPRKYHEDCYEEEPADEVDYWPPKAEFPSDEELQRQELRDERL